MFKFVLCALLAFAVAEPEPEPGVGILPYSTPYYGSTYLAPSTTTITKTASSYIANPYIYSSPYYPHYIKKRSAPFYAASSYLAPSSYAYSAYSAPLVTSYSTPLVHSAPLLSTNLAYSGAAHLIKKRSAPLLPTTYIAPTSYAATAPLLTTPYAYTAGVPIVSSAPLLGSPLGYSHFIKKRSVAPLLPYSSSYIAPAASYSYSASAPLLTSSYAAPIVSAAPYYSAPFAYSTYIKK